jgi:hypothetical protein
LPYQKIKMTSKKINNGTITLDEIGNQILY